MAVKAVGLGETVRHQFENNMLFKTMERFIAKKQVWGDCVFLVIFCRLIFVFLHF